MFDFLKNDKLNYATQEHNTTVHAQRINMAVNKRLINVNHEEEGIKSGGDGDVNAEKYMATTQIALRLYKYNYKIVTVRTTLTFLNKYAQAPNRNNMNNREKKK